MRFPVALEPVKVTVATSGCSTSTAPTSLPPARMLTTPGGNASIARSESRSVESGVIGDGLSTTVLPPTSGQSILLTAIASGKFQGQMAATTPRGAQRQVHRPFVFLSYSSGTSSLAESAHAFALPIAILTSPTAKGLSGLPCSCDSAAASRPLSLSSRAAKLMKQAARFAKGSAAHPPKAAFAQGRRA